MVPGRGTNYCRFGIFPRGREILHVTID